MADRRPLVLVNGVAAELPSGDFKLGGSTLPVIASPPVAAANMVGMFGRSIAGRILPSMRGPNGIEAAMQPLLARSKVGAFMTQGNGTALPGVFGLNSPVTVGTLTQRNVATTNGATRMRRLGFVSAATAGSLAGHWSNASQFSAGSGSFDGSGFFYVSRFVPSNPAAVSGERRFIGLSNSAVAPTNVEPSTLVQSIGMAQLSTDATQWYLVYGGTAAQSAIACGTALGAPTGLSTAAFEIAIWAPNTVADTFYVQVTNIFTGATFSQTITGTAAQVPVNSVLMGHRAWACNNATALAVGIDVSSYYVETDA